MRTLSVFILGIIFLLGSTSFTTYNKALSYQAKPKWEKLGSKVVNMKGDHDVIMVTAKEGVFSKVKLRIMKAPIHLLNINIIFRNGTNKSVVFNKRFAAGSWTRIIDLPGNKRIIKKVNLNYKTIPAGKGRAVISLFGRH